MANGAQSQHERMLEHLAERSAICTAFGSPFSAELCDRMQGDFRAGGPLADLIGQWPTHPRVDALAVRPCGALHAAALSGRDAALTAQYPEQRKAWNMDEVWSIARAFFAREHDWVAQFIKSDPQTNEVRRSIALLAGFLHFANTYRGPFELLEYAWSPRRCSLDQAPASGAGRADHLARRRAALARDHRWPRALRPRARSLNFEPPCSATRFSSV